MRYRVLKTQEFDKACQKHNIPQSRIKRIRKELKTNPYSGRHLSYEFLREKRYEGKRIYFLIYEEFKTVFLVAISNKNTQEKTIEQIKTNLSRYRRAVVKYLKSSN